ncbi:MAG TPA: PQQ-binding-like beta-propeller repeat protein [Sedimentisphaerales bacterium]|nr:PQQ-binding-like beta-propeller repeat protein [Sedimentisphaerales bacterium]
MNRSLRFFLSVLLCSVFFLSICGASIDERLLSDELLGQAGLVKVWDTVLPIGENEKLQDLFMLDRHVLGLSSLNYLVSMNRLTGHVSFSKPVAEPGIPFKSLSIYDNELYSIIGNKIVEISPDFGIEKSSTNIEFNEVAPAARNKNFYYVAATDKRVHALQYSDKVQLFEVAAFSDSQLVSVIAQEDRFIFASKDGDLICCQADKAVKLWHFKAADAIVDRIVEDNNSVYVASNDTNIYCVDKNSGKLCWKYQVQARPEQAPVVMDNVVYQYLRNYGIVAIDKKSGEKKWQLQDAIAVLAENEGLAYVITKPGKLVVMDNKKNETKTSVDFSAVEVYLTNVADSKIYVANKAGKLMCLQPAK